MAKEGELEKKKNDIKTLPQRKKTLNKLSCIMTKKEIAVQPRPSVVDQNEGLDDHVPVSNINIINFNNLQGLINIHSLP